MPGLIGARLFVAPALAPNGDMVITAYPVTGGPPQTKQLPITPEQWNQWQRGAYIQDALAHLSAADREWLMTGIDQEHWDRLFKENDHG